MLKSSEEILEDIHATLDQLMQNAEALKVAKASHHFEHEIESLECLQESLLARLLHRQDLLEIDKKQKIPQSIRKETIRKAKYNQKFARSRKAFSKS